MNDKIQGLENLKNTENFKQGTKENALNHIFDGEILKMEMLMVFIMKECIIVMVKL
ncbi:hypothetical protein ACIGHG_12805 [Bacillus sp. NPDC077411]|uniref:hypothetical protein n=1 Tax=Bacillus sp. NPDC077411 TaxID=3363947 RepID=UPI0037C66989